MFFLFLQHTILEPREWPRPFESLQYLGVLEVRNATLGGPGPKDGDDDDDDYTCDNHHIRYYMNMHAWMN